MTRRPVLLVILLAIPLAGGCHYGGAAERFGKIYYLDGAGNLGFGAVGVPKGLKEAGYKGDVEIYVWTLSFNPLIDQLNIPGAKLRAAGLADRIKDYHRRYPKNSIDIISLSAGTGVATWAIEALDDGTKVDNLVLLGSSLSHDYDMTAALKHMTGKIYVYHSPHDKVLESVKLVGTIDGKRGVASIGLVGLTPPHGLENRVVNIGWDPSWVRLGWAGAHGDCANYRFVHYEIARQLRRPRERPVAPPPQIAAKHSAAAAGHASAAVSHN